jgi:hypothetical protein
LQRKKLSKYYWIDLEFMEKSKNFHLFSWTKWGMHKLVKEIFYLNFQRSSLMICIYMKNMCVCVCVCVCVCSSLLEILRLNLGNNTVVLQMPDCAESTMGQACTPFSQDNKDSLTPHRQIGTMDIN